MSSASPPVLDLMHRYLHAARDCFAVSFVVPPLPIVVGSHLNPLFLYLAQLRLLFFVILACFSC